LATKCSVSSFFLFAPWYFLFSRITNFKLYNYLLMENILSCYRYQGNQEIYYQNEGSGSGDKFNSKPPRGPNRMTASIESLGGSGSSLERGRTSKYKSRTNVNGL
jgi:hypothetical protein